MKVAALLAMVAAVLPGNSPEVSVAYAGSLVRVMEGPIAKSFTAQTGIAFRGEGKGSKALARLIADGDRTPDIFITADPKLYNDLHDAKGSMVHHPTVFASARMLLGCARNSPFLQSFRNARTTADFAALLGSKARVGRTDPRIDPKGERTLTVLARLNVPQAAQNEPTFPEEDLLARLESGELDCGFFYSTELHDAQLVAIELPPGANLDGDIQYAIAILRDAPHPQNAQRFVDFILHGDGRAILEQYGMRSIPDRSP
ncbi:MAG: extracellular solute-binding protein [Candidatus Eremiobacteraeota bacterium]|nr:extracellular solute-binding protein [Candidatus Eremiobacteraeota bacterium]